MPWSLSGGECAAGHLHGGPLVEKTRERDVQRAHRVKRDVRLPDAGRCARCAPDLQRQGEHAMHRVRLAVAGLLVDDDPGDRDTAVGSERDGRLRRGVGGVGHAEGTHRATAGIEEGRENPVAPGRDRPATSVT